MLANNSFGDLLTTLLDRRAFGRRVKDGRALREICEALLSERIDDLTKQVTRRMLSYALGRQLEYYDEATVRDLVRQLQADERRMQTLILGIVLSDTFLMKQK